MSETEKKAFYQTWWFWAIIISVLVKLIMNSNSNTSDETQPASVQVTQAPADLAPVQTPKLDDQKNFSDEMRTISSIKTHGFGNDTRDEEELFARNKITRDTFVSSLIGRDVSNWKCMVNGMGTDNLSSFDENRPLECDRRLESLDQKFIYTTPTGKTKFYPYDIESYHFINPKFVGVTKIYPSDKFIFSGVIQECKVFDGSISIDNEIKVHYTCIFSDAEIRLNK